LLRFARNDPLTCHCEEPDRGDEAISHPSYSLLHFVRNDPGDKGQMAILRSITIT